MYGFFCPKQPVNTQNGHTCGSDVMAFQWHREPTGKGTPIQSFNSELQTGFNPVVSKNSQQCSRLKISLGRCLIDSLIIVIIYLLCFCSKAGDLIAARHLYLNQKICQKASLQVSLINSVLSDA